MITKLAGILLLLTGNFHPIHVSVCTIEHNPDSQSLQVTIKIFADDLEDALNQGNYRPDTLTYLDTFKDDAAPEVTWSIEQYLSDVFEIRVNEKKVTWSYLGQEREDLAMWCYLEVADIENIKQVEVRSQVLMGVHRDQINLVHVRYNNNVKSMKLAVRNSSDQVIF